MLRFLVLLGCLTVLSPVWAEESEFSPKERTFEFTYEAMLEELPEGADVAEMWVPVPSTQVDQEIEIVEAEFPAGARMDVDPVHGNRMLHVRWEAPFPDERKVRITYRVRRSEVSIPQAKALEPGGPIELDEGLRRYLGPSVLVPLEGPLASIADELELSSSEPIRAGRKTYDYVVELMSYGKDQPGWGRGDVLWACDSRTGNCSDFHSVFTGLTRTRNIPSYFEIGFPLPPDATEGEIGGYHCWAWFSGGEGVGWIPVDASEADKHPEMFDYYFGALTANRVAFSKGRDLMLVPRQQGDPINFFIYPYVEIDGQPGGLIEKRFSFRDVE